MNDTMNGEDDDEETRVLGQSVVEIMHTVDHDAEACACLLNCADMCCLSEYPDQFKMYMIQKKKMDTIKSVFIEEGKE